MIPETEPGIPMIGTEPISIEIPPENEPLALDRIIPASASKSRRPHRSQEKATEDLTTEIKKPPPKKRGRRKKDDDFGLTWFK
jgi:hypothetical protein